MDLYLPCSAGGPVSRSSPHLGLAGLLGSGHDGGHRGVWLQATLRHRGDHLPSPSPPGTVEVLGELRSVWDRALRESVL